MKKMKIKVLYFASLADRLGVREDEIELPLKSCVGDALEQLAQRHAEFSTVRDTLAFAVNLTYVDGEAVLADGDELALIPPVSGG
ncbi:MAG: molybdopterin converting factor subunit 1 [Planctomycetota bacterium]